jgi:hypothetical protein
LQNDPKIFHFLYKITSEIKWLKLELETDPALLPLAKWYLYRISSYKDVNKIYNERDSIKMKQ